MPNSKPDPYDTREYGPVPGAGPVVQGKVAIVAIAFLGVAASVGSCVYYARLQQQPIAFWGTEPARLMLRAPKALAYRLEPVAGEVAEANGDGAEAANVVELHGRRFRLVDERDVTQAPGFSHIRQSFVHGASFDWESADGDCDDPQWTHALRFSEGDKTATILFAFNCGRVALAAGERAPEETPSVAGPLPHSASIKPVAAAIEEFFVALDGKKPAAESPAKGGN